MPPPPLHPSLPPRPCLPPPAHNAPLHARPLSSATGQPLQPGGAGAGLPRVQSRESTPLLSSLPSRPAFLPQTPGSPRLNAPSPLPHSPKLAPGGAGGGTTPAWTSQQQAAAAAAAEDPWTQLPSFPKPEALRTSWSLVELGEGWEVRWRAWKGPAIMLGGQGGGGTPFPTSSRPASPGASSASASASTSAAALLDYDPFAARPDTVSHLPLPSSSASHPRPSAPLPSASLPGSLAPTPEASTSAAPPPAKKPKRSSSSTAVPGKSGPTNAFDELLAEEMAVSPSSAAATDASGEPQQKKKGRLPKAVREAQAAAAAAAAAQQAATSPSSSTAPTAVDLPPPSPSLGVSQSSTADPAPLPEPEPEAGPSAAQALRERLEPLRSTSIVGADPVRAALRAVKQKSRALGKDEDGEEERQRDALALFAWVEVAPVKLGAGSAKGKEKAVATAEGDAAEESKKRKEREEKEPVLLAPAVQGEGRTLWVFSVVRGGEGDAEEEKVLDELSFEDLEPLASGHFSHASLFPALYPTPPASPSSALQLPLTSSAKAYPSALALSSHLLTIPTMQHRAPARSEVQAAYEAFREAARGVVLDEMALTAPSAAGYEERTTAVRMKDSVLYLPPSPSDSASLPSLGPSTAPLAVRASLLLPSLNSSSLVLQPRISEEPFAALPGRGRVRRGTPVCLAPTGVEARVIKELRGLSEAEEERLMREWADELSPRTDGVKGDDEDEERWVLCALELPSQSPSARAKGKVRADQDRVEIVWPRSLIVVDGSRPFPPRSRSSSPSRLYALTLPSSASSDDGLSPSPDSSPNSSPDQPPATALPHTPPAEADEDPPPLPLWTRRRRLDPQTRERLAAQALGAGLRCSPRARPRRGSREDAMALDDEEEHAAEGAFRDPIKRTTGDVWRWMEEEARRREHEGEEKERAVVAATEKQNGTTPGGEKQQAEEKGEKSDKAQVQAPPAAAPINMRTPMSLGTASTEAPSPAELFTSLTSSAGHPGSTAFAPLPPSSSSQPPPSSTSAPMGMDSDLLALGVYPSPAEPLLHISTSAASAPPASSAAPVPTTTGMSALDAAFSSFDWGDGTFGTSDGGNGDGRGGRGGNGTGGNGGGGGEFDDGLMLGLTDDDFSFFDDPPVGGGVVALPPSTTAASAALAPLSLGFDVPGVDPLHDDQPHHPDSMGPMILDPFSSAPAAESSLIAVSEPFSFGEVGAFDPSTSATNALGLSATAPPSSSAVLSLAPPAEPVVQPIEQFFPPYSPAILPPSSSSAFPFTPSLGSAPFPPPTPANPYTLALPSSYSPTLASSGSAFSPIPFAVSHLKADEKYSQHGGKYGLPSPDSDGERAATANGKKARQSMLELLPVAVGRRCGAKGKGKKDGDRDDAGAARSWFEAVCDPRIAVAERLRLARRNGGKKANAADDGAISRSRGWVRSRQHRHSKQLLALPPPPFGTEAPSVEPSEAGESYYCSSCSDDDDDEPRGRTAKEDRMDVDRDEVDGEEGVRRRRSSAVDARARAALGASLLLLGGDVDRVLRAARPASPARGDPEKTAVTIDSAKEITLAVVAEQAMSNREFRDATLALFERKKDELSLVSFHAISHISNVISGLSSSLGSSSLFDDETALPSLLRQEPPSFLLRTQQCIVEANTASVSFWRPMGFEPLAGSKDVQAFAVYEDAGSELHESARTWLKMMCGVYQGLRLGEHSLGSISASSNFAGVEDGLIPLPAGLLSDGRGREELKMLYAQLSDFSKTAQNTVVYIISPFASSPLSATSPLAGILHQISKSRAAVVNMHPCPVSLSTILSCQPSLSQRGDVDRLVRLAFSVYDQLQIPVARLRMPQPETFPSARPSVPPSMCGPAVRLCQAPAITLSPSPTKPSPVQFALSWPPQSLEVESRHRFLHVCYGTRRVVADDPSQEWLAVTMIDEKGEQWRNIPRYIKIPAGVVTDVHRVRVVWSFTKGLVDSADIEWRVVVCKLGEPSAVEAKAWDSLLKEHLALSKRPIHVTFACVDLDPALFLSPADPPSRRSSTASMTINEEEGELSVVTPGVALATASGSNGSKPPLFDDQAGSFSFTPSEPVSLVSLPLLAPASTYIIHVPRLHTFTHSTTEPFQPAPSPSSPAPISVTALHFLFSHASRTSSYTGTLGELVDDVRTSFVELAALGKARWGTSGRVSWHLEAASQALALAEQL